MGGRLVGWGHDRAAPTSSPASRDGGDDPRVVVIGPDGMAAARAARPRDAEDDDGERNITDLVEQPAKVMRIGSMIRQLLEEVKSAPARRGQPRPASPEIHQASIKELEAGLAPELVEELERLSLPFTDPTPRPRPSCGSPRPSWSAGSRASSTASRPRSTPSRWPPAPSSSRCAGRCRPGWCPTTSARRGRGQPGPGRGARQPRRHVPLTTVRSPRTPQVSSSKSLDFVLPLLAELPEPPVASVSRPLSLGHAANFDTLGELAPPIYGFIYDLRTARLVEVPDCHEAGAAADSGRGRREVSGAPADVDPGAISRRASATSRSIRPARSRSLAVTPPRSASTA